MPAPVIHYRALTQAFLITASIIFGAASTAQTVGGCDNYTPTEGQTVTCSPTEPTASSGVQTTENSTANNNVTVNVLAGTEINLNGSPIGIGAGSTINNFGTLNSRSATNGYGMSSGVNGRSEAGGSTLSNFSSGVILTAGGNGNGIYILAGNAGSLGNTILNAGLVQTSGADAEGLIINSGSTNTAIQNTITNSGVIRTGGTGSAGIRLNSVRAQSVIVNTGSISTTGNDAPGIYVRNTGNIAQITQSGTIAATGASDGVYVLGAASITNSGTICSSAISGGACVANTGGTGSGVRFDANANTNRSTISNLSGGYIGATSAGDFAIRSNLLSGLDVSSAGTISALETAIYFESSAAGGSTNSVRLLAGSVLNGGISFNTGSTQEKLIFDGFINTNFNNTITGLNNIEALGGSNVVMNNPAGYAFGTGVVSVASGSILEIATPISDTVAPSFVQTSLNKTGDGLLTLSGSHTYTGNTTISAGTLLLNGSINSNTTVMAGAILQGGGAIFGAVNNLGVIQPSATGNPTNLTIAGNYVSSGGVFVSKLYTSQPNLIADTLTILGPNTSATGSTQIGLNNTQLLGTPTSGDGILLIQTSAGATTSADAFYYPGRIAAGAYEYRLIKGGESSAENWYLRSDNTASIESAAAYGSAPLEDYIPTEQAQQAAPFIAPTVVPTEQELTPEPTQRIEVANYPSIPSLARLYMLSTIDSFDQRRNDLAQSNGSLGLTGNRTSWGRVLGKSGELRSDDRNQGPALNARTFAIQLGSDLYRNQTADGGQTFVGPFITLGQASGNTYNSNGSVGTGNVLLQAYSLGLNATHITAQGLYVDTILQVTRLSGVRANSILGASMNTTGWGLTASLETGWKFRVSERVSLTPQAQLIFNNTQLNDSSDFYATINIPNDTSLTGRVGIKVAYDNVGKEGPDSQAWLRLSGLSTLTGRNAQLVFQGPSGNSNVAFNSQLPANWLSLDAGLNVKLSKNSQLSFALGYDTSVTNAYKGGYGQIGLQVAF